MESILFDGYRKYQKEQKDNFIKAIFKLPVWVQIFLAMIVLCLVYSVLVLFVPCLRVVYGYCLAVEVLTCVVLYFYTENFQIKTSDSRLFVYQEYCEKIKHWLDSVGVNVTPENITEIMTRTNKRIDMLEKKRKERRDRIDRWIQILIIPILLAIFSAIIKEQTDLSLLLVYAVTMIVAIASMGLAFLNIYNILDFFQKRKLEQKFVDINNYLDDGFFEIISKAEIKHLNIAIYLNKFSASELSAEYIKIIDSLEFDDYISEDIIDTVLQEKHYYTPLLFLAKENDFSKFDSHLANNLKLLETCEKINEDYQDVIIGFRKYAFQNKARSEYKILYFEPFPIISTEEYVSMTEASELFKLVDTSQISEENYSEVSDTLCERTYATSELVDLFDWLFNNEKNENCISDPVLRKNFFESLDLRKLELRKLDDQQRNYTYSVIADVIVVNTPDDAISAMKRFDCLIPEIEPIVQKDIKKYSALIASMNEFSSETLKWLDENFIRDGLSETLCKVLYEKEDYINFIIADVLRKKDMILDENIPFEDYISVYEHVPEMFSIMSEHYDFLEKLQLEADLDKLPQEKIVPMFKVPQHKRFFEFIFSSNQPDELKNEYLSSFGKLASLDDSLAFQKLVCKEENMKLLGSHRIFNRIHRNLWELNRGHKGVFTRKWNECWKDKLDETHLL